MVRLCLNRERKKSEARNWKNETISNDRNQNDLNKDIARIAIDRLFLSLASLMFEIVSNFAIRMSRLADRICRNHALWA
jgi:hypothetical protein